MSAKDLGFLPAETERAEALAKRLGTDIPGMIDMRIWMLPLLEKIVDRLEKLEKMHGK